jgi:hypothetical protein
MYLKISNVPCYGTTVFTMKRKHFFCEKIKLRPQIETIQIYPHTIERLSIRY